MKKLWFEPVESHKVYTCQFNCLFSFMHSYT